MMSSGGPHRRKRLYDIYVANQTDEDLNVYFDDLTIEHIEGPIVQTDDYYPFGLTFNSSERSGFTTNKFLYNGKELQSDLDLDWYDYGARMYDAAIGRWHSVDPLAEKFESWTPYKYGLDNPIRFIDMYGLSEGDPNEDEKEGNLISININGEAFSMTLQEVLSTFNSYFKSDDKDSERSNESDTEDNKSKSKDSKKSTRWKYGIGLTSDEGNGEETGYTADIMF